MPSQGIHSRLKTRINARATLKVFGAAFYKKGQFQRRRPKAMRRRQKVAAPNAKYKAHKKAAPQFTERK